MNDTGYQDSTEGFDDDLLLRLENTNWRLERAKRAAKATLAIGGFIFMITSKYGCSNIDRKIEQFRQESQATEYSQQHYRTSP